MSLVLGGLTPEDRRVSAPSVQKRSFPSGRAALAVVRKIGKVLLPHGQEALAIITAESKPAGKIGVVTFSDGWRFLALVGE